MKQFRHTHVGGLEVFFCFACVPLRFIFGNAGAVSTSQKGLKLD